MTRAQRIEEAARALEACFPDGDDDACWPEVVALRAALALPEEESEETIARVIHGLVEAGEILFQHVQRIDFDPTAATVARETWLESVALLNGDDSAKHFPPWPTVEGEESER